ncbi:MAG: hypothetical protein NUV91_08735 [Candidatus Omnitrophica bacterium]|nr:hypothetical protein [Candidatus Omnitrophota bacterium]
MSGKVVLKLDRSALSVYEKGIFSPTWVSVFEERFGGNGDIWVADGYGMHQVHRYSKKGEYLATITGEGGPHRSFQLSPRDLD